MKTVRLDPGAEQRIARIGDRGVRANGQRPGEGNGERGKKKNDRVAQTLDRVCAPAQTGKPAPHRSGLLSPQRLLHGTEDDSVPYSMSERYAQEAAGEAELVTLEGAGHFEPIDPQAREWPRTLDAVRSVL